MKTIPPKEGKRLVARLSIRKERRRQAGTSHPLNWATVFSFGLGSVSFRLNGSHELITLFMSCLSKSIRVTGKCQTLLSKAGEVLQRVLSRLSYGYKVCPLPVYEPGREPEREGYLTATTPTVSPIITHLCKCVVMRGVKPNYIILTPTGSVQIGTQLARSMPTREMVNFEAQCGARCIKMYRGVYKNRQ